jgi:hypothetical protein
VKWLVWLTVIALVLVVVASALLGDGDRGRRARMRLDG